MKNALANCIETLINKQYGSSTWSSCLQILGVDNLAKYDIQQPSAIRQLVEACVEATQTPRVVFFHELGEFWSNSFAPNHFKSWFIMAMSTKEFAAQLDRLYEILNPQADAASHKRVRYNWLDANTLRLHYEMDSEYIELFESLASGIAKYYNTQIQIEKNIDSVTIFHF